MAKGTKKKKKELTIEEKLEQALVPEKEWPYEVPKNWCWTYIQAGFDVSSSKRVHKKDWLSEGIPFYRTRELVKLSEYGYVENELFISQELYRECKENYGVPKVGDLLISGVGTIGVPYIVEDEKPFYFKDGNVIWFQNKGLFLPRYIFHLYKGVFMYNQIHNKSAGTTVDTYTIVNAKKTVVPLPPLAEQQRIVNRIESLFAKLDEAKEKAQAVVDGFENRKAAILHKAFTGELTNGWRENNGLTLQSWSKYIFDDCIETMQNGIAKRKGDTGEPYVVLRLANLSDEEFDENDLREIILDKKEQKKYELQTDDVLMIRVNGSKDNVGKQYHVTNQKRWAFCDHIIRIRYVSSIIPQFMVYFSKTEKYRRYIKDNMVSSAGQNTISRKGMAKLQVPIPMKAEQERIILVLTILLKKEQEIKENAKKVIDKIDTMKKSILSHAFRGELGTNNPTDESAGELLRKIL